MRLWSFHPKYLDGKGLVALWREGLLARRVLLGQTIGYRQHPQLSRFRASRDPVARLDGYLSRVLDEAERRGYLFDHGKIYYRGNCRMTVTEGQICYEWEHLKRKLKLRDPAFFRKLPRGIPEPHPCFRVVAGQIESFERPR